MANASEQAVRTITVGEVMDWIRGLGPDPRLAVEAEMASATLDVPEKKEVLWGRFTLTDVRVDLRDLEEVRVPQEGPRRQNPWNNLDIQLEALHEVLLSAPLPSGETTVPSRFDGLCELDLPIECMLEEISFPQVSAPPVQITLMNAVPGLPSLDLEPGAQIEEVLEDAPPPVLAQLPWKPRWNESEWMG